MSAYNYIQNIYMARSPIFIYTNVQNGTLNSAFAEIRITSGSTRRTSFGTDPITYTLQADAVDNCVYFEISELIRDYITLNFKEGSNVSSPNYNNLSGGFFRFPQRGLYATVDVRFKRTVNGNQQGYFTDSVVGKLVTLGFTKYEFGPQFLNGDSSVGYPTFYKKLGIDTYNTNSLTNWQLYQEPTRPLVATKKFIKPIYAPVEFMCAKPWSGNTFSAQTDSFFMTFRKGNVGNVFRNLAASQTGDQLSMFRLGYYFTNTNYGSSIKDFAKYPQSTDPNDPKFQYQYADSPQLNEYLDSEDNDFNEVDKLYYSDEYNLDQTNFTNLRDCYEIENRICFGYTPMKIIFLNRYGVFEILWYFKNHRESISIKSTKFKRNILDVASYVGDTRVPYYERQNHQNFILDKTATKTIVLNSDWYPEEKNDSFEDLILSTHVWLEWNTQCFPVNVKDTKFTFKNRKTDGLINHQLTVEIATDYINSIS